MKETKRTVFENISNINGDILRTKREREREIERERERERDTDTEIQNRWLDFRFRALYIEISENPLFYLDFGK